LKWDAKVGKTEEKPQVFPPFNVVMRESDNVVVKMGKYRGAFLQKC